MEPDKKTEFSQLSFFPIDEANNPHYHASTNNFSGDRFLRIAY
jgi:hypothetical protein